MVFDLRQRRLRRAVADLSRLRPEDAAGVLELMPAQEAETIRGLLTEWVAPAPSPAASAPVSAWLADRLTPGSPYPLTPAVRAALAAFAQPSQPTFPLKPSGRFR